MTDRILRSDVDRIIESINSESFMEKNKLKMRYYSSCGSMRVGLILDPVTNSETEFKHELKHRGVHLSLLNFRHLMWIMEDQGIEINSDIIISVLKHCGFTYYR